MSYPSFPVSRPPTSAIAPSVRTVVGSALRGNAHSVSHRRRAQQLAWDWVSAKWPRLRPSLDQMESAQHESSAPGLELRMAARDDGSAWTLSVAQFDRHSARTWMTRVLVADHGDADLVALQTACTELPNAPLTIAPPRLLGMWVERLDLDDAGLAVIGEARTVEDDEQLDAFCTHVLSPARRLPVIALANNPHSRFFGVDPRGLAEAVRGLAHVACVAPGVAAEVGRRFGSDFGVVAGAARVYTPGFSVDAAAADHPLFRDARISGRPNEPGAFRRVLCRRICAISVDTARDFDSLLGQAMAPSARRAAGMH